MPAKPSPSRLKLSGSGTGIGCISGVKDSIVIFNANAFDLSLKLVLVERLKLELSCSGPPTYEVSNCASATVYEPASSVRFNSASKD